MRDTNLLEEAFAVIAYGIIGVFLGTMIGGVLLYIFK